MNPLAWKARPKDRLVLSPIPFAVPQAAELRTSRLFHANAPTPAATAAVAPP